MESKQVSSDNKRSVTSDLAHFIGHGFFGKTFEKFVGPSPKGSTGRGGDARTFPMGLGIGEYRIELVDYAPVFSSRSVPDVCVQQPLANRILMDGGPTKFTSWMSCLSLSRYVTGRGLAHDDGHPFPLRDGVPTESPSWMSRLSPRSVSVLSTWFDSLLLAQNLLTTDESRQHGPWKAVQATPQAWKTYVNAQRVVDQSRTTYQRAMQQAEADPAVEQAYAAYQQEKQKSQSLKKQAYAAYQQEKQEVDGVVWQAYNVRFQAWEAADQAYHTYSQAYDIYWKPRRRKASQVQSVSYWEVRENYEKTLNAYEEAREASHKAWTMYQRARQKAETEREQAWAAYLDVCREVERMVEQAEALYQRVKQEACAVPWQAYQDAIMAARQAYDRWKASLADHRGLFRILTRAFVLWGKYAQAWIRLPGTNDDVLTTLIRRFLSRWEGTNDDVMTFIPKEYKPVTLQTVRWVKRVSLPLSVVGVTTFLNSSSLFNAVSSHCGQPDPRYQRRARRSLILWKTLYLYLSTYGVSADRIRLLRDTFGVGDVGRHGSHTAGWLDQQNRSANLSTRGFALIGKKHLREQRKPSRICPT